MSSVDSQCSASTKRNNLYLNKTPQKSVLLRLFDRNLSTHYQRFVVKSEGVNYAKNDFVAPIKELIVSIKSSLSDSALQSIASVNLSFGPATAKSQDNLEAIFTRIESGETSYEQEENILLEQWHELHRK